MELGPIQKQWLKELREHPERQFKGALGQKTNDNLQLCCLAQLAIVAKENDLDIDIRWIDIGERSVMHIGSSFLGFNHASVDTVGLTNGCGQLNVPFVNKATGKTYYSLGHLNDFCMTWPEIADYVEANPNNVFTKSY